MVDGWKGGQMGTWRDKWELEGTELMVDGQIMDEWINGREG